MLGFLTGGILIVDVTDAIMKPAVATLPELDARWGYNEPTPMWWTRNDGPFWETLLKVLDSGFEFFSRIKNG
jgi:hypothetical protein